MATWCARLGRAVALTVAIYVLVTVGGLFLAMTIRTGRDAEDFMMISPFFFAGGLVSDLCSPGDRLHIGGAIFWTLAYASAALALLIATLISFNRCLGRVEGAPTLRMRRLGRAARVPA